MEHLWLILLVFVAFGLVFYLLSRYVGIKRLRYQRYFSQPGVFEGESVSLVEEIHNHFFLPLFFVDVEAYLSNELRLSGLPQTDYAMQHFTSRFFLWPYNKIKRDIPVVCRKRGYYELDTVSIGFLASTITLKAKTALYVYPQTLPQTSGSPLESAMQNMVLAEKPLLQDPFSLSGIRDYRSGDPFSSINFKATAKTGALKVNHRDFMSSRNFMIYLDFHNMTAQDPLPTDRYHALLERALSYAADMVQQSVRQGYAAGFAANCKLLNGAGFLHFPMGRGHDHYLEMLCAMATIRLLAGNSFAWLLRQDYDKVWNAEIYVMTVNENPEWIDLLDAYRNTGNHVSIVILH